MYCKICGTFNEDYMEYCENCAAPLEPDAAQAGPQSAVREPAAEAPGQAQARSFAAAPSWPKPDFDANTVIEDDIPENYKHRYSSVRNSVAAQPDAYGQASDYQQSYPQAEAYQAQGYQNQGYQAQGYQDQGYQDPGYQAQGYAPQGGYDEPYYDEVPATEAGYEDVPGMPQGYAVSSAAGGGYQTSRNFGGYDSVPTYDTAYDDAPSSGYMDTVDDGYYGFDNEDEYEDEPAERPSRRMPAKASRRSGGKDDGRMKTILFWAAAGVLVILIAVFLIVFFTKRSSGTGGGLFAGLFGSSGPVTKAPEVETGETQYGEPAYIITVYGKNGYIVRFTYPYSDQVVDSDPITKKSKPLRIAKAIFIPDEPIDSATIEVIPDIVLVSSSGEETAVEFSSPIVITLPTIELALTEPVGSTVTTTNGTVSISGVVGDTSAAVFVEDQQLTVDEAGNFSGTYKVTESGTITIEARKNGYKIERITLNVEYTPGSSQPSTPDPGSTTTPPSSSASILGFANTDSLNIRSEGSTDGSIIGTYSLNQVIEVINADVGNGWTKVLYNNTEAYVAKQYVTVVGEVASLGTGTATVNTSDLNFRASASTSSSILSKLPNGTAVTVLSGSASTEWCTVRYDGKIGYLASKYLKFQ